MYGHQGAENVDIGRYAADILLRIVGHDKTELQKSIEAGSPFTALLRVHEETGIPLDSLARLIQVSPRTLTKRKVTRRLTARESESLYFVTRLASDAIELFNGRPDLATRWLSTPSPALGGPAPIDIASTETGEGSCITSSVDLNTAYSLEILRKVNRDLPGFDPTSHVLARCHTR